MKYFLTTEAMRVVERNDKGNVVYRKRYKKGDEVDTSHMEEAHVENLVAKGTLVESEDDVPEQQDAGDISPVSGPFGAASAHQDGTTPAAPPVEPVQGSVPEEGDTPEGEGDGSVAANTLTPSNPESQVEPSGQTGNPDDEDVEDVDRYSDMDHADLVKEAKNRDLRYVGVSTDDLRASLRESDNA